MYKLHKCASLPHSPILIRSNCSIASSPYLLSQWLQGWAGPLPHWMKTCQIYNPRLTLSWLFDSVEMTQIECWIFGSIYKLCLILKYCNTTVCDSDYCGEGHEWLFEMSLVIFISIVNESINPIFNPPEVILLMFLWVICYSHYILNV